MKMIEESKLKHIQRQRRINRDINLYLNFALFCAAALSLQLACEYSTASYYGKHLDGSYDPEQQDGIPVFSARSVSSSPNAEMWTDSGENERLRLKAQRRQADGDLDDEVEDDDNDEYKSGSNLRESVESPSYGESLRSARDGDEIEDFFDKHLGPPKEATIADETIIQRETVPATADPDDHYEAAASSPLSSIFQSLLGRSHDHKHNSKLPFLQITTTSSSDLDSSKSTEDSPKISNSNLKASQSAQSFVEASPLAIAITPISQTSTSVAMHEPSTTNHEVSGTTVAQQTPSSGVREIYIGRRPSVVSYLQQAYNAQQQQQLQSPQMAGGYSAASSANVWRGADGRPVVYEQEQSSDYPRYPVAATYAYQREQPTLGQGLSPSPSSAFPSAAAGDEEQTVTYGLSFGGSAATDSDEPSSEQEVSSDQPASGSGLNEVPQQQPESYVPYNTRYATSSTSARNNYYNNHFLAQQPVGFPPIRDYQIRGPYRAQRMQQIPQQMMMVQQHYVPQQSHQQQQLQPQQQYQGAGATRYHRDPSESANHSAAMRPNTQYQQVGSNYAGLIGPHRGNYIAMDSNLSERQRLLASLDREIKASPQYRSGNSVSLAALANSNARRLSPYDRRQILKFKAIKDNLAGDDLDSYNSYHSETDPYKTFTTMSRMVNDPIADHRASRPSGKTLNNRGENSMSLERNQANRQSQQREEEDMINIPVSSLNKNSNNSSENANLERQKMNKHLLSGPLINYDTTAFVGQKDLLRTHTNGGSNLRSSSGNNSPQDGGNEEASRIHSHSRVRRDDSDEREIDNDADDDGVWVDDDEDDDNKQQSSDVNETSQHPDYEDDDADDAQQDVASENLPSTRLANPPGVIGGPHGYELSPNDLMIYHG